MPQRSKNEWFDGQNLIAGALVNDDTGSVHGVHWFAARPSKKDETMLGYEPVCGTGNRAPELYCEMLPNGVTDVCGLCAAVLRDRAGQYRVEAAISVAEYVGAQD